MKRVAIIVLLGTLVALVGCSTGKPAPDTATPEGVVSRVLELRHARATRTEEYEPYFADSSVAAGLAKDSAAATGVPVPEYADPYVSAETSSSASVVVRWRRDDPRFKAWPAATVFTLSRAGDGWVIADAAPVEGTVPPAMKNAPSPAP